MMLYAVKYYAQWRLFRNKREALRIAKDYRKRDSSVEVWSHADVPEIHAWDWPTFRIGATRIYPTQ